MSSTAKTTTMHTAAISVFLFVLIAGSLAAQGADIVQRRDGVSVRGVEVTSFTLQGIEFKRGKDSGQVLAHQIADVLWGNVPEVFASGTAAMRRGDYRNAANLFGEAVGKTARAVLKTEARFQQAKAAVALASSDKSAAADAAGALRAWLAEAPDSWRVPEATLLLGRALRLGGLVDDAIAALRDLDDRATREGWGTVWSARAKYETALTLLASGKPLEARSAFQAAAAAAETALGTPSTADEELRELRVNARVGEGETFLREKNFARALEFFRGLASGNDAALAAAGRAGEGEALYLIAAPQKKLDDLRTAQIALARASVLDAAGSEVSAKANYYLGLCVRALGPDREGDGFKARADGYLQLVIRSYPTSPWAAAAREALGK